MTIYANREVSNRASERNNKRILYRFDGVARKNKEKLTTLVSLIISNKQRSINDAVHKLFYLYNQSIRYYFDPCRASRSSSIQPGYNLDTTWILLGYNLDTTWILLGYYFDPCRASRSSSMNAITGLSSNGSGDVSSYEGKSTG